MTIEEKTSLDNLAQESSTDIKIKLSDAGLRQRNAALVFARNFSTLSDEAAEQILKFLENDHERIDATE